MKKRARKRGKNATQKNDFLRFEKELQKEYRRSQRKSVKSAKNARWYTPIDLSDDPAVTLEYLRELGDRTAYETILEEHFGIINEMH